MMIVGFQDLSLDFEVAVDIEIRIVSIFNMF